ncbi:MAG: hypothetical protein JSU57_05830 [Candidatus Heimdallarchaeota archaeon]|nr:MAG: hypothetical protein JSU57_05830 [Candidatus Heimdallarchaeota archaeon]
MLITTSRDPNHYLRRVSKIIALSFPNSQRMNRGSLSLKKLFSYCWNKQISRLLILQGTAKEDLIIVKAYLIGKIPQLVEATIKLTNIITLQKNRKKHRITVEKVCLDFSEEVNKISKERITDFFQPLVQESEHASSKNFLTIRFRKETRKSLIGQVIQENSSLSLPLYNIHISSECVNNEYQT